LQQPPQQAQQQQQQQPEIKGPLTRASARAMERNKMTPSDAIRLIRKVNLAASKHFQPVPHFDVSEGPDFVADNYGLPKQLPGVKQPQHILRRHKFLKSVSPQQRNLLLTGDPMFAFDPIAYQTIFFSPQAPQILKQEFEYRLPNNPHPQPIPEQRPPTLPLQLPPVIPAAPIKHLAIREVIYKPQLWPTPADGASPFVVDPTSPAATCSPRHLHRAGRNHKEDKRGGQRPAQCTTARGAKAKVNSKMGGTTNPTQDSTPAAAVPATARARQANWRKTKATQVRHFAHTI